MASSESWSTEANCGSPPMTRIAAAVPPQEDSGRPEPRNPHGRAQQPFLSNPHPLDPPNAPYVSTAQRQTPNYPSSAPGSSYFTPANSSAEVRDPWQPGSEYTHSSSSAPYPSYIPRTPHSATAHWYPPYPPPNSNVPTAFISSYPVYSQAELSTDPPYANPAGSNQASSVPPLDTPSLPYAHSSPFPHTSPSQLRGPQAPYDHHPAPWSHISPPISPINRLPQINPVTGSPTDETYHPHIARDQDAQLDKMGRELRKMGKGQKKRHAGENESDDESVNDHAEEEQRKERRRKKRRAQVASERKPYRRDDDNDKDDPAGPMSRREHYSRRGDRDAEHAGMAGHNGGSRSGGGRGRE